MNFISIINAIKSLFKKPTPQAQVTEAVAKYPPVSSSIISTPTPNFQTDPTRTIKYLIIHSTGGTAKSCISWLTNPEAKVSAHYLIDKAGAVYQFADEKLITWHAGKSSWGTDEGLNKFSIGIELENLNNGVDEYSIEQICVAVWLSKRICASHQIPIENVLRHLDIAPGRKSDPVNFPWTDFIESLRRA